jgi:hypothetical protein
MLFAAFLRVAMNCERKGELRFTTGGMSEINFSEKVRKRHVA